MLMVCVIALLVSAYYRRRIRLPFLMAATAVFFLPTTLNETKGTLVMLPVALLLPALLMPSGTKTMRRVIPVAIVGVAAGLAFVSVYNYFIQYREFGKPLETFFTEGHVRHYLYTGADPADDRAIGRFDSISLAFDTISRDPLTLAFGLGAGNVSPSSLPGFEGEYAHYFERYGVALTQITNFLWEIGFVGLAVYLLMYALVFQDSLLLARRDGAVGLLGQVWATVTVMMGMALFYKSVFSMNEIGYLFWFYSGIVAGKACAVRRLSARRRSSVVGPRFGACREAEA